MAKGMQEAGRIGVLNTRRNNITTIYVLPGLIDAPLNPQKHAAGVFDVFFDAVEEAYGVFAVDDAVVVAEGYIHDGMHFYFAFNGHRAVNDVVHAEDGALRRVDDGGRLHGAENPAVGDGEGAAVHFFEAELSVARTTCQAGHFLFDLVEAERFSITNHRHHESFGCGNGHG